MSQVLGRRPTSVRSRPSEPADGPPLLLVTGDRVLADHVARVGALAGRTVTIVDPAAVTRPLWSRSRLVGVGVDAAHVLASRGLPRRVGVLLLCRDVGSLSAGARSRLEATEQETSEQLTADQLTADQLTPDQLTTDQLTIERLTAEQQRRAEARRDGRDPVDMTPDARDLAFTVGAHELLELPADEARLLRLLASAGGSAPIVGVLPGCGGAGASTLACALGMTAARLRVRAAVVDGDPLGSGLDLALASEDAPGVRWPQLRAALDGGGRDLAGLLPDLSGGGRDLAGLLPDLGGVLLLSMPGPAFVLGRPEGGAPPHDLPPDLLAGVLMSLREGRDLVLVDLPRHAVLTLGPVLDLLDIVLLVVPPGVRAVAAAATLSAGLRPHVEDLRLVLRGPAAPGLPPEAVADALDLPLVAELPHEPGLGAGYDRGVPPTRSGRGSLARSVRGLLSALVQQPEAPVAASVGARA